MSIENSDQKEGLATDTVSSVELGNTDEAIAHFEIVKQRFLDINRWRDYMLLPLSSFTLVDKAGHKIDRQVRKGDYIKISLPAPTNNTGRGFDWVQVQELEMHEQKEPRLVSIVVHPVAAPITEVEDDAHFFDEEASSTFVIRQEGSRVSAEVHGRNMKANTSVEDPVDKIRNIALTVAAYLGFSKLHWKNLVSGLVSKD